MASSVKTAIADVQAAYERVFTGESTKDDGEMVLKDLMVRSGFGQSAFVEQSERMTNFFLGRQDMVQHILDQVHYSPEELYELRSELIPKESPDEPGE